MYLQGGRFPASDKLDPPQRPMAETEHIANRHRPRKRTQAMPCAAHCQVSQKAKHVGSRATKANREFDHNRPGPISQTTHLQRKSRISEWRTGVQ